jgi:hypothetical protein
MLTYGAECVQCGMQLKYLACLKGLYGRRCPPHVLPILDA